MPKAIDENYEEPEWGDVILKLPDDESFDIGQSYERKAATTICCKKCGGREFVVGQGNYHTAIKCPKCEWQLCIHDG